LKRNSLSDALIDDVARDLGESVNVGFAGAEVTTFDRFIKEPIDAIPIAYVVLGRVNPALSCDRMCPPGRILVAEGEHVVAKPGQCGGGRSSGQARSYDDDSIASFIVGAKELKMVPVPAPPRFKGTRRGFSIEYHQIILLKMNPSDKNG
jgi:hypothetical protein